MTSVDDTHPEDAGEGASGGGSDSESRNDAREATGSTALSERAPAGLDADLAAATRGADDRPEAGPRTLGARLLDYSAHAAMIVGLIGFAWTVSNHVVAHPAPAPSAPAAAAADPTPDPRTTELADLRQTNQRLAEDVRHLRANLDALAATVHDDRTPAQVKVLQAGLENVQGSLAAVRSETGSAVAQLKGRLDKVASETGEREAGRPAAGEHAPRPDRTSADLTTGSLPPAGRDAAPRAPAARETQAKSPQAKAPAPALADAVPMPPAKPAKSAPGRLASLEDARRGPELPAAEAEPAKPPVIAAYVVRDVYDGVAVIEGRGGVLEVVPGVSVPGAGVVKSIERRGRGWTVITTKGQLAYAAPGGERRTSQRDFYPAYRYDF